MICIIPSAVPAVPAMTSSNQWRIRPVALPETLSEPDDGPWPRAGRGLLDRGARDGLGGRVERLQAEVGQVGLHMGKKRPGSNAL